MVDLTTARAKEERELLRGLSHRANMASWCPVLCRSRDSARKTFGTRVIGRAYPQKLQDEVEPDYTSVGLRPEQVFPFS